MLAKTETLPNTVTLNYHRLNPREIRVSSAILKDRDGRYYRSTQITLIGAYGSEPLSVTIFSDHCKHSTDGRLDPIKLSQR